MKRAKYYFRHEDSELCYTLDEQIDMAKYEGLSEIELFTAKPQKVDGFIWCHAVSECEEKGGCGKGCDFYRPRNGKSGMCKHQGKLYEPDKKVTIKISQP